MGKLLLEYIVDGNVSSSKKINSDLKVNELRAECLKLAGIEGVVDIAINESADIFDYAYVVFDDNFIVRSINNLIKNNKDLNYIEANEVLDDIVQIKFELMFYDSWVHNNYLVILDFEQVHEKHFGAVDIKILVATLTDSRDISFVTWCFDIFACYIFCENKQKFNILEFGYNKINVFSVDKPTNPDNECPTSELIERLLLKADIAIYVHFYLNDRLRKKFNLIIDDNKQLIIKNQQNLWKDADEWAEKETEGYIRQINKWLK